MSEKKVEIQSDESYRFTQDPLGHLGAAPQAGKEPWICGQPLPPGAVGPPHPPHGNVVGQHGYVCRGDTFWLVPVGRELNSHCAICHTREQVPVMRVAGGNYSFGAQGEIACGGEQCQGSRFRLFEAGGDLHTQCETCEDWQPLGTVMLQPPK